MITFDNIETFLVDFDLDIGNWIYKKEERQGTSQEHKEQIAILDCKTAKYLWGLDIIKERDQEKTWRLSF